MNHAPAIEATYEAWMDDALTLAEHSGSFGDVPVGALVIDGDGAVISCGENLREADADPSAHAEIVAMRRAAQTRGSWRLDGCTLVVTLEPCVMCAGAAMAARIDRIVLGAWDRKAGACGGVWDVVRDSRALHRIEVIGGIREEQCALVLTEFFGQRR